jgi:hypothetical protein
VYSTRPAHADAAAFVKTVLADYGPPAPLALRDGAPRFDIIDGNLMEERLASVGLQVPADTRNRRQLANILVAGAGTERARPRIAAALDASAGKTIPLESVLPWVARNYTGKGSFTGAPNCFAASINWHFPSTGMKCIGSDEMVQTLHERYAQIPAGAPLQLGDLITVSELGTCREADRIEHSLILIDSEHVWQKAGRSNSDPPTFARFSEAIKIYFLFTGNLEVRFYRPRRPPDPEPPR